MKTFSAVNSETKLSFKGLLFVDHHSQQSKAVGFFATSGLKIAMNNAIKHTLSAVLARQGSKSISLRYDFGQLLKENVQRPKSAPRSFARPLSKVPFPMRFCSGKYCITQNYRVPCKSCFNESTGSLLSMEARNPSCLL